ncbi:class I adenylate-forming enzyme family protein [Sphingomonas oligophenolica]|uniref:Class I adenylate-forming enzyme family protein n=1 Tax=Sphingomonas oligophenolica TaxID=301154 RepID=A0ABU9YBS1_9SPHN
MLSQKVPPYSERRAQIEAEPLPENLGALLDEAAAEAPDTVALNFFEDGETLTYRELQARVNRLASGMVARGIGKGSHIGVMIPNISAFPISWLAIARIGAVMIPINIAYTGRELEYVLETGDADYLLIDESCLPVLAEVPGAPVATASDRVFVRGGGSETYRSWDALADGQPDVPGAFEAVDRDDLLNIQFTSGTTGFPKGCMLTQDYWLLIGKQAASRDGRRYLRILASTPFFYMDPQWGFLMAMYQRGTLFVARRQSGSRFMKWVREHRIQFGLLPEVVFKQPSTPEDGQNEVIRMNIYGVSRDLHAAIEERFDLVAREAYGMTEIGSGLSVPIEAAEKVGSGSCGVPAPFREARIADPEGNTLPQGEVGELLIRGRSILKGYYNNPEATAASFHGEWFRTGDLFQQDDDGYFRIVGRVKDMIRRAGENISAREVEAVIVALPEVAEVAALPVKDDTRGEEIKVCITLRDSARLTKDLLPTVIRHCQDNLAPFKVPRYYAFPAELPHTASGKIAKAQLIAASPDLRAGSYDRVTESWVSQ